MVNITLCEMTLMTVQSWQYESWCSSIIFSKNMRFYAYCLNVMDVWKAIFKAQWLNVLTQRMFYVSLLGSENWIWHFTLSGCVKKKTEIRCYTFRNARSLLLQKEMFCFISAPSLDKTHDNNAYCGECLCGLSIKIAQRALYLLSGLVWIWISYVQQFVLAKVMVYKFTIFPCLVPHL
jgi:hypothetical protein